MPVDAQGRRYYIVNGRPYYNVPINTVANPDPTHPSTGFFQNATWDPNTGTWKKTLNKTNLVGALALGAIAAPAVAAALPAGAAASGAAAGGGSAAAGGGATTAAAAGGGMGWLDSVLKYGVPAVGNLYSARTQNSANRDAAQIESRHYDQALQLQLEEQKYQREQEAARIAREQEQEQYKRQQYATFVQALSPYLARYRGGGGGAGASGGETVMLRAPNGETRAVPAAQADHYLSQGATRVTPDNQSGSSQGLLYWPGMSDDPRRQY